MPAWWEQLLHITTGRVRAHDHLPDLRHLPTRPVALERTHYLVNDRERHGRDRRVYVLRSEPRAGRRGAVVAVSSNGRGVGYLPAHVAEPVAAMLDRIGGAAVVNGAGPRTGSIRLWVDLPTPDALRGSVSPTAGAAADAPADSSDARPATG